MHDLWYISLQEGFHMPSPETAQTISPPSLRLETQIWACFVRARQAYPMMHSKQMFKKHWRPHDVFLGQKHTVCGHIDIVLALELQRPPTL